MSSSEVQKGQRMALISISDRQKGQVFVVDSAGVSSFSGFFVILSCTVLMALTIQNTTNAVNALPMITPTARSMTFPLEINFLNSLKKFFISILLFSRFFIDLTGCAVWTFIHITLIICQCPFTIRLPFILAADGS